MSLYTYINETSGGILGVNGLVLVLHTIPGHNLILASSEHWLHPVDCDVTIKTVFFLNKRLYVLNVTFHIARNISE